MRSWATTIGLAALAIGAVWVAKTMVKPTQEKVERNQSVLNRDAAARVLECRILEDSELPETLPRPEVGGDTMYVLVTVHYPGYPEAPDLREHALVEINGHPGVDLRPVHVESEPDENGSYALLTFRATEAFAFAKLIRSAEVLMESLRLE